MYGFLVAACLEGGGYTLPEQQPSPSIQPYDPLEAPLEEASPTPLRSDTHSPPPSQGSQFTPPLALPKELNGMPPVPESVVNFVGGVVNSPQTGGVFLAPDCPSTGARPR